MPTFKLANGTEVTISINVNVLKRCRDELKIDLAGVFQNELLDRLYSDPALLCDVLFVCCEASLTKLNLDDVAFGEQLASGDTIAAATDAFMEALVVFTPPGARPAISKTIEKIRTIQAQQTKLALQRLDSPLLDQLAERQHQDLMTKFETMLSPSQPSESGKPSTN